MRLIKRLLALVIGILGVIGLLVCIAGVIGIWLVEKPVQERTKVGLEDAGRALKTAVDGVKAVHESLQNARKDLESYKEVARKSEVAGKKPDVVHRVLAQQLESRIQNANATVNVVTDASVVLNSLLSGLNHLPDTSITMFDLDRLKEVQGSLGELTKSSQQLSSVLDTEEGRNATAHASQMDEVLIRVLEWVTELQGKIVKIQSDVEKLNARTPGWIHSGAIILTVVLSWIAISQFVLIVLVRSWFKCQAEAKS